MTSSEATRPIFPKIPFVTYLLTTLYAQRLKLQFFFIWSWISLKLLTFLPFRPSNTIHLVRGLQHKFFFVGRCRKML